MRRCFARSGIESKRRAIEEWGLAALALLVLAAPLWAQSGHHGHEGMKSVTGGPFQEVQAIGSGTALAPATSPMPMWHFRAGQWDWMLHGEIKAGFNHQGGPRGIGKGESQNWLMVMGERGAGPGRLILRGMFSAEPLTTPHGGFPQLFQAGESYRGIPIIDAQHPHDLFMELAVSYTVPLTEGASIFFYGGPVAEPALGPVAFMHRASAAENPAAPLGHHMQDSTHISHGVITSGATLWRFRVEGSLFRGAEPDENRVDIEMGRLDSWSTRISFTPDPDWVVQFSHGHLTEPEFLKLGDVERTTASISYNRAWEQGNWATTAVWGRAEGGGVSNSYLLESTLTLSDRNRLYTRLERVDQSLLFLPNVFGRPGLFSALPVRSVRGGIDLSPKFHFLPGLGAGRVGAYTVGGVRDVFAGSAFRLGVGGDVVFHDVPPVARPGYGSPMSVHLFFRVRPGKGP